MIFASKTPRDLNHAQHNPPSPILVEFRSIETQGLWDGIPRWMMAESWVVLIDEDPTMSRSIDWGSLAGTITSAQRDHARRVLSRLADFGVGGDT